MKLPNWGVLRGVIMIVGLSLVVSVGPVFLFASDQEPTTYQAVKVDITAYSPTEGQTDERPRETASGKIVTDWELKEQRFVAVSQDLLDELGIKWGDTVWLPYIVEDTMHSKVKLGVDMFVITEEVANDIGRKTGIVLFQISKEE